MLEMDEVEFTFFEAPPSPPASSPNLKPYAFADYDSEGSARPRGRRQKRSTPVASPLGSTASLPLLNPALRPASTTQSTSTSRSRTTSTSRSPSRIPPHEPLIADLQLRKTRLVLRKSFSLYNSTIIPFRSALVGLNVTFHTVPSSTSRVKDAHLELVFHSPNGGPAPIIKAMAPDAGVPLSVGVPLTVVHESNTNGSVRIGYDPYASISLSAGSSKKYTSISSAKVVVSGVETHKAWVTVEEDPTTREGVPTSFDFAILLYLPDSPQVGNGGGVATHPNAFEVELSVEASLAKGAVQEQFARFLGSPREWRLGYDGVTELGVLKLAGEISPKSGQVIMPVV